ncbi:MAG: hypothetical protein IPP32_14165 [Bacteroidetes bacterium]|nr:hypothetical protein [Bacteroidota bacterium]
MKPTAEKDYDYALKDTLEFNKLKADKDINDDHIIGDNFEQDFSKKIVNGKELYSVIIMPNTALCGGYNMPFFKFSWAEERHRVFTNVIEMTIIRLDTKDTIYLNPTLLADFSRQFGEHHIALIFD